MLEAANTVVQVPGLIRREDVVCNNVLSLRDAEFWADELNKAYEVGFQQAVKDCTNRGGT